jgi:hypothetical protein
MQWFLYTSGRQEGPLSWEVLVERARDGSLRPTDLVWNESMGDTWAEARTVPGLFLPPPLPVTGAGGPPVLVARAQAVPVVEETGPMRISCTAPVSPAWDRMKDVLFRPFNLGKWFALGFSAWLATLGDHGGSFNPGSARNELVEQGGGGGTNWQTMIERVQATMEQHGSLILGIAAVAVVAAVVIGLLVLWLRCRGRFMFLDNCLHDRADVISPWGVFKQHANSLFWWSLVYGLICLAVTAILVVIGIFSIVKPIMAAQSPAGLWPIIGGNLALWVLFGVVGGFIGRFLEDFVVPIMYNDDLTAAEAWSRFVPLFMDHTGSFVVYGLFYVVLNVAMGFAVLALILVTCCVAGCLMMIPYVGTVVLLPALVFFRLYSVGFLAQFGPRFRMRSDDEREQAGDSRQAGDELNDSAAGADEDAGSAPLAAG